MAGLVLRAAGAAAGYAIGGFTGAQIGWTIGGLLSPHDSPDQPQRALSQIDLKVPGTDYGQCITYARGSFRTAGQIWWNSDRRIIDTVTSTGGGGGGKGGGGDSGGSTQQTVRTYEIDLLIGLTINGLVGVSEAWDNGKLFYNVGDDADLATLQNSAATENWDRMTVYPGGPTQLPDPDYEAAVGTLNAPAYRTRGTIFIKGLKLGESGQMRALTFKVVVDGTIPDPDAGCVWTAHHTPAAGWNSVAYGDGLLVAVTNRTIGDQIITSLDSDTWTPQTSAAQYEWHSVCHGNGLWVAVSTDGSDGVHGRVMSSPDGFAWTLRGNTLVGGPSQWRSVIYGGGKFVAVGSNGYRSMSSADGSFWAPSASLPNDDREWFGVAYGNGVYAAISQRGTGQRAASSSDGVIWALQATPADNDWKAIAFGNGLFVAVSDTGTGNRVMTSPDGETWTARASAADLAWASICFANGVFVAVASGATTDNVMISDDGINWALCSTPVACSWHGITASPAGFTAVASANAELDDRLVATSPFASAPTVTPLCPTVRDVYDGIFLRAGLTAGQFDTSLLDAVTRDVCCFVWTQISSARSVLEILNGAYFIEITLSGDKIKCVPRGSAPVMTIPFSDLGAGADGPAEEPLELQQVDDLQIPAQIAAQYVNIADDYQAGLEMSDRVISAVSGSVQTISLNALGLVPSESKQIADAALLDRASSVLTATIALLGRYCVLEPCDILVVVGPDGSTYRMRIIKTSDSYPLLKCDIVLDDASILSSQGITSVDYTPQTTVAGPIATTMELLDIPILSDADDDPGFYAAVKGDDEPYPGAEIISSPDDVAYVTKAILPLEAVLGRCTTTLGDWTGPRIIDEVSTVTVEVNGLLSSSTYDAVINNQAVNACVIGLGTRRELLQFITAELQSEGVYTLSRLLRGSRGTEWAMVDHVGGERFCLLQAGPIRRVPMQNSELGALKFYKGVTRGRAHSTAPAQTFTDTGVGLKPFSPVDLRMTRDGSNNITGTFERRTRLSTRMIGMLGISVPLGEDIDAYTIEVYSDDTYTTLLRTITTTTIVDTVTRSFVYSAADQVSDGLSPGDEVNVIIYQRSTHVGLGYPLRAAA